MNSILRTIQIPAMYMILAAMMMTTPASAQSDSSMRRENDALRARIGELESELEASRDRVHELEDTVSRLQAQIKQLRRGASGTTTEPLVPDEVTIDESMPNASPRALLKAVTKEYEEHFADMEKGSYGDRDRSIYLHAVRKWTTLVNRKHRGPVNWIVRVTDFTARTQRGVVLTMQAVDPITDTVLGDNFEALISSKSLLRRLEAMDANGSLLNEKLDLKGVLLPNIRINANRETQGTFNNPPFIGPFAEFAFGVEVQSLRPAMEVDAKDEKKPTSRNAS